MIDALAAAVTLIAAWNPAAVAGRTEAMPRPRLVGLAVGAAIAAGIALFADPILEALSVSAPTFRTAAGAVLGLTGARWLVAGAPEPDPEGSIGVALIDSVTPATVLTAMTTTVRNGWAIVVISLGLALAATVALAMRPVGPSMAGGLRRSIGGIAVAAGVGLVYAGIRSV